MMLTHTLTTKYTERALLFPQSIMRTATASSTFPRAEAKQQLPTLVAPNFNLRIETAGLQFSIHE